MRNEDVFQTFVQSLNTPIGSLCRCPYYFKSDYVCPSSLYLPFPEQQSPRPRKCSGKDRVIYVAPMRIMGCIERGDESMAEFRSCSVRRTGSQLLDNNLDRKLTASPTLFLSIRIFLFNCSFVDLAAETILYTAAENVFCETFIFEGRAIAKFCLFENELCPAVW